MDLVRPKCHRVRCAEYRALSRSCSPEPTPPSAPSLAIYLRRATEQGSWYCPTRDLSFALCPAWATHTFFRLSLYGRHAWLMAPVTSSETVRRMLRFIANYGVQSCDWLPCKLPLRAHPSPCPSYHRCRRASALRHCQGQVRVTCRGRDILQLQLVFGCMRAFSFDCFLALLHQVLPCLAALLKF
jgi:hypothetical protein